MKGVDMRKISQKQLAAMNMIYNRYSFEYFVDSILKLGIKQYELWTGIPHIYPFLQSMQTQKRIREISENSGLKIVCVTPEQVLYPFNIASANQELRELSIQYFIKNIQITAEVGADKMLCCAGWGEYDRSKNEAWKRSMESLGRLLEAARENGIELAFEVLNPAESNLVYNLETTKKVFDKIDDPYFGLCVDTVPVRYGNNTLQDYFDAFKDRIIHVHLTDGSPLGHVPCGTGNAPIQSYLEALSAYDYKGYITLEIGDGSWNSRPETATQIGFEYVKKILE